jgi:predicted transcriptional regulator
MSETRDQVARCVRSDPGIHFNELVRTLDLAPGQVQYHTRKLVRRETLIEAPLYGKTHYYPPDYDAWERRSLALLRRETAADIVACLMEDGPMRPVEISDRVDIARSTLSWHTDRLVAADIVEKQHSGTLLLALVRPERTARLFREADPSLSARLVDRFTRLVDNLLVE